MLSLLACFRGAQRYSHVRYRQLIAQASIVDEIIECYRCFEKDNVTPFILKFSNQR
jgi:hypothetical protein